MLLHRERARAIMAGQGIDALIGTSAENVTYATGYLNWPRYTFRDYEAYAVVPRVGSVALVVPIDAADYLAGAHLDQCRLYTYGTFHTMRNPDAVLAGAEARLLEIREHSVRVPG